MIDLTEKGKNPLNFYSQSKYYQNEKNNFYALPGYS
jgi:hypothetical protein